MKHLSLFLSVLILTACGGSGGSGGAGGSASPAPGPGVVTPSTPKAVTLHKGAGYECFAYETKLLCRGTATNADIRVNSVAFALRASAANGISGIRTWDDTLCFETTVAQRPYARSAGLATYCFGEASLMVRSEPIVYSPAYSHAANGTASVAYTYAPFAGADMSLTQLVTITGFGDYIVTDGTGAASTEALSCALTGTDLVCPTFTVSVQ